jgi:hypothetical protein
MSAGRLVQILAGGIALPAMLVTSALADVTYSEGCVRGGSFVTGSGNCVFVERSGPGGIARIYKVDEPDGEALDAALERDRKWLARCKPVIRRDTYGVGRYYYAAEGCEFGKYDEY